jgi:hypothetical protein
MDDFKQQSTQPAQPEKLKESVPTTPVSSSQDTTAAPAVQVEESEQDRNWKKFREQREIERKQLEAEKKRAAEKEKEAAALKAAMDSLLNKPDSRSGSQREEVDYFEDDEEKRIEKLVEKKLAEKERIIEQQRQQREQQELPQRLKREYPDFDQVCTSDNLDYLEYHYPEVATAFGHMPDGIEKWTGIYKAAKRFVPNIDAKRAQARAQDNLLKPQSASGASAAQAATPNMARALTDSQKAENYRKMQAMIKGQG